MACGCPSCCSLKSSLVRLLTIWPCLSRTVASTLTTLTSEENVGTSCASRLFSEVAANSTRRIGAPNLLNQRHDSCGIELDFCMSNRVYLILPSSFAGQTMRRGTSRFGLQVQEGCQVEGEASQPYHGRRESPRGFK